MLTFDPTTATEDEVNAAYKAMWRETMESHGVTNGWDLPKPVRIGLGDTLRRWWKQWNQGRGASDHAEQVKIKIEQRKTQFESQYGVSDKAPPRRTPVQPENRPDGTSAAPVADRPATAVSRPAPSVPAAPTPMDFGADGTADDVDKAVRSLFGTSMEDM